MVVINASVRLVKLNETPGHTASFMIISLSALLSSQRLQEDSRVIFASFIPVNLFLGISLFVQDLNVLFLVHWCTPMVNIAMEEHCLMQQLGGAGMVQGLNPPAGWFFLFVPGFSLGSLWVVWLPPTVQAHGC